jgi:hypothetical protein
MKLTFNTLFLFLLLLVGKSVFAQDATPGMPNELDKTYVPDKTSIFNSGEKPATTSEPRERNRLSDNPCGSAIVTYLVVGIVLTVGLTAAFIIEEYY